MVKKSKKKGTPRPKPKREAGPNMFERLGNKKRFDILGRKTKGEVRSVNKLRSAATEKVRNPSMYRNLQQFLLFYDFYSYINFTMLFFSTPCSARLRCSWSTASSVNPTLSSIVVLGKTTKV